MAHLFDRLKIRQIELKNRIAVSPMCQYSSGDGFANNWHLVHLGSRAVGGAALVMTEATAVSLEGRISPADLGIWKDEHIEQLRKITRFIAERGAVPGIQLAHAGRKGSRTPPWEGNRLVPQPEGGWKTVAPSATPFSGERDTPAALDLNGIRSVASDFKAAAARAITAGFKVIEIHSAHGYLLHQFLSPLSNKRTDAYGGVFDNRIRLLLEVVAAIRSVWPERFPLFVRISATDWVDGGWTIEESVRLAGRVKDKGVDLVDCSSGGIVPDVRVPVGPGYQVPFAERIRKETGIRTGAVGMIVSADQAETIIAGGQADIVLLGREMLRDPYFPLRAAYELDYDITWPVQYLRAKRKKQKPL
jgi:2,4-dienoyl-CoA reductase-like NADH-dependent reductase (Old Yellow Enzyme family)